MPKYEYQCQNCSYKWEAWKPVEWRDDVHDMGCLWCDGKRIRRVPSWNTVGFNEVKGTGNGPIGKAIEDKVEEGRRLGKQITPDDQVERALRRVGDEQAVAEWTGQV